MATITAGKNTGLSHTKSVKAKKKWLLTDDDGEIISRHPSEKKARSTRGRRLFTKIRRETFAETERRLADTALLASCDHRTVEDLHGVPTEFIVLTDPATRRAFERVHLIRPVPIDRQDRYLHVNDIAGYGPAYHPDDRTTEYAGARARADAVDDPDEIDEADYRILLGRGFANDLDHQDHYPMAALADGSHHRLHRTGATVIARRIARIDGPTDNTDIKEN